MKLDDKIFLQDPLFTTIYDRVKIQGDFFNWPSPISVPKIKLPSSQSGPFLVTGFTEHNSCDWLIGNFLFGTKIREGQLKKSPCIFDIELEHDEKTF